MPRPTPHHPLAIRLIMDPIPWILPIINPLVDVLEFPLVTLVSSYRSTTKLSLLLRQGGADSSAQLQQLQKYPIPSLLGHAPAPTLIDTGLIKPTLAALNCRRPATPVSNRILRFCTRLRAENDEGQGSRGGRDHRCDRDNSSACDQQHRK
jgi:hypothetical protein